MRLFKFISLFLLIACFSNELAAKDIQVALRLLDIKALKTEESGGDELYFHTTQYSNLHQTKETRVPVSPIHWLSKQLDQVKNVVLWEGLLQEGESIQLLIALLDQDLAPWDVDDLLGSAELTMANQKGRLEKEWKVPILDNAKDVEMPKLGEPQQYIFKGMGSRYEVTFKIEEIQQKSQKK